MKQLNDELTMSCFVAQILRVSPRKVSPVPCMLGAGTEIEGGKETPGWVRIAQQQQLDLRHMIAPRCTAIAGSCLMYKARRLLRSWKEIQQKSLEGEDAEELWEKLFKEQDQFRKTDRLSPG